MLDLNVTGQVRLAKRVVKAMAEQRHGRILITTSLSALTPTPYESIYGPTRAFMFAFAQGLREEMKEYGVRDGVAAGRDGHRLPSDGGDGQHRVRVERLEERPRTGGQAGRGRAVQREGSRRRRERRHPPRGRAEQGAAGAGQGASVRARQSPSPTRVPVVELEETLDGGNDSGPVVRIGSTVRKPWLPSTPRVVAYLSALRDAGIDVPRTHGRDEKGRLVLDFVPGTMAMQLAPLPVETVNRVGGLVRTIHDASARLPVPDDWPAGLLPAPARHLVCHNDLATWNLVIDGDRLVFIDWDGAAPSSRSWDLAYAAVAFAHLFPGADVTECASRLTAFVDGYDAGDDLRKVLPGLMAQRSRAMYELLRDSHQVGREPWGTMFVEGHGEHWLGTTRIIEEHESAWMDAVS